MFVLRSTYTAMRDDRDIAVLKYNALLNQWNALVAKINAKGGSAFLDGASVKSAPLLTQDDLKRLLMLCHPDKHDGKPQAVEMTQKLLALRSAL